MDKKEIRLQTLQRMKQLNDEQRQVEQQSLYQQVLRLIETLQAKHIALYYSVEPEVALQPLMEQLIENGCTLYLPCLRPEYQMVFVKYQPGDALKRVYKEVKQPVEDTQAIDPQQLDLVIVPGVAFTPNGDRIGFGGGYYDRWLSNNASIPTVSLVFSCQLYSQPTWCVEQHDQAIQHIFVGKDVD